MKTKNGSLKTNLEALLARLTSERNDASEELKLLKIKYDSAASRRDMANDSISDIRAAISQL